MSKLVSIKEPEPDDMDWIEEISIKNILFRKKHMVRARRLFKEKLNKALMDQVTKYDGERPNDDEIQLHVQRRSITDTAEDWFWRGIHILTSSAPHFTMRGKDQVIIYGYQKQEIKR